MTKKNKIRLTQIIVSTILLVLLLIFDSQLVEPYRFFGYVVVYFIISYNILKEGFENIFKGDFFDENLLMIIATVGAFFLKEYDEGIMVMLLFQIGELLQGLAIQRSKRSITHLLDLQPNKVMLKTTEGTKEVPTDEVKPGSTIIVRPGERIAIDGVLESTSADIDESAITGESIPVSYTKGSEVKSGAINLKQKIEVKTTVASSETTTAKMIELVKKAQERRSDSEEFIRKFARYYTPIVVIIALALAVIPLFFVGFSHWQTWVYRALIFLVISCPCALVISVPLSFFAGIGAGSKQGILFKGSEYIEQLTKVKNAIFDKTGTLTTGKFHVDRVVTEGMDEDKVLTIAAMAEQYSTHPIAVSIKEAYGKALTQQDVDIEELSGYGVKMTVDGHICYVGNEKLMTMKNILVPMVKDYGTVVYVSVDQDYVGYLLIKDTVKKEAFAMSDTLKKWGIQRYLVTGDRKEAAMGVMEQLHFDHVYSQVLPSDKVRVVEDAMAHETKDETTIFVGDGLNDAPVIATADVGIAMGGVGSQATIEAADIVLMDDNPEKVATAMTLSRKIMNIVKMDIIFALGIKIIFLILAALGLIGMEWAVFADVGVTIITILNAMRILIVKK